MRETLDLGQSRLLLDFPDRAELDAYVDRARGYGFTVRLDQRLEPGSGFEVVLTSGATSYVVPTRIKQVFRSGTDRFGTIFEVPDWSVLEAPAAAESESSTTETNGETSDETGGETSGTSLAFDIRKLNASERIRLASKAQRPERQVLLRDPAPPVAMALLSNPRIEIKEVLEIVKNPQAASGVLQRVAQDRRFAGNYEIQLALVKNPRPRRLSPSASPRRCARTTCVTCPRARRCARTSVRPCCGSTSNGPASRLCVLRLGDVLDLHGTAAAQAAVLADSKPSAKMGISSRPASKERAAVAAV